MFIPRFLRPLPLPPLTGATIDETTTVGAGSANQIQCVII